MNWDRIFYFLIINKQTYMLARCVEESKVGEGIMSRLVSDHSLGSGILSILPIRRGKKIFKF